MSAQAQERTASWDEIICCPLFRRDPEQLSYERGRQFGVYVLTEERQRVPLMKGVFASPRAKILLMMAMREGALR